MGMYLVKASYSSASWKALVSKPVDRELEITASAKAYGVTVHQLYFAFGEQDVMVLAEAPDSSSLLAFLMAVSASGAVDQLHTTVLITSAEAKAAMETAKSVPQGYRPPGATEAVEQAHKSPQYYRP